MLAAFFIICLHSVYAQPSYTRYVDTAAKNIDRQDIFYFVDSIQTDSINSTRDSLWLMYADVKAKWLLKAYEITSTTVDTTTIEFYFSRNKLIKVFARNHTKNRAIVQSFYFKDNKLVFPDNYYRDYFKVDEYLERAKKFAKLKYKSSRLQLVDHEFYR